jgi:endonuclease-3 related protein
MEIYDALDARYRSETWHWMPDVARGPIDVIAGAVLVQHTQWANAERALHALHAAGTLDIRALATLPLERIEALVRVSGMPAMKARRLRAIAETIERAGGLDAFFALPDAELRELLLATHGIGPETADAIMLYAAGRPSFVIDAYTRRTFGRVGLGPAEGSYADWQRFFVDALAGIASVELFQRYHGHIVLHGKDRCGATPRCAPCPLLPLCVEGRSRTADRLAGQRAHAS